MTKQEFSRIAKQEIPWSVYGRIEAAYMDSNKAKDEFVRAYGKAGIIKAYDAELSDRGNKLSNLARAAIESYDRCHSPELIDASGRVTDYDLWGRLMARYSMACDALGIDEYAENAREQLWGWVII